MREVVLFSLDELAKRPEAAEAVRLLAAWSPLAEGQNVAMAACHYLAHFAVPSLEGVDCAQKKLPRWVDEKLFHPPAPVQAPGNPAEWLGLFPGSVVCLLPDRKGTVGRQVETREWDDSIVPGALEDRYGVFFTPNGMGTRVNEKGNARNDLNASRFNAVFVDYDAGKGEAVLKKLGAFAEPTAVVETKKGYHAYWLLADPPNAAADAWQVVQERAIAALGGDPAAKNPSRLMRVPWAWHCKEEPYLVTLRSFSGKRHALEGLAAAFQVDLPKETAKAAAKRNAWRAMADALDGAKRQEVRPPPATRLGEGFRHGTAKEEVARMYARLDEALAPRARAAAALWYENSCEPLKNGWQREIDGICDWVETREYGRVVS